MYKQPLIREPLNMSFETYAQTNTFVAYAQLLCRATDVFLSTFTLLRMLVTDPKILDCRRLLFSAVGVGVLVREAATSKDS